MERQVKMKLHDSIVVPLLIMMVACQTGLQINTDPPGAEVFAGNNRIGVTPLLLDEDIIESTINKENLYVLKIESLEVGKIELILPALHSREIININLGAIALEDEKGLANTEPSYMQLRHFYETSAKILQQQTNIIYSKDVDSKVLAEVKKSYPDSGSPYIIEGLNFYIKGDPNNAKKSLNEALNRNPWEEDYQIISLALDKKIKSPNLPRDKP